MRVVALACVLLALGIARAGLVSCGGDDGRVAAALRRIGQSIDPCGESAEIARVLDRLAQTSARYEICETSTGWRNVFDRGEAGGTITWNPELRSELEPGCDGDPARPVMRDPTASLLHELVHALHDCEGGVGDDEVEAVRIENIYRRAAGLCQRSRYGDERLPAEALKACTQDRCACAFSSPGAHGDDVPPCAPSAID